MSRVLVIAPHPDDETLGAGGTLLRHRRAGDEIHWAIATEMRAEAGYPARRIEARRQELEAVHRHYGFSDRHELGFEAAALDTVARGEIVRALAEVVERVAPAVVYVPFAGDAHSDHGIVAASASAALKWFRAPCVERILAYETLSETGFNLDPSVGEFRANWYVDISAHLDGKREALALYGEEFGTFPFPRSVEAVDALARLRGAACGASAAEAFVLLRGTER